jgi:nucleoside-diphosphate-sugar epimerase
VTGGRRDGRDGEERSSDGGSTEVTVLGGHAGEEGIDAVYRGVPALVLGGAGFIGAWTVRALLAQGAAVTVTARDAARAMSVLGAMGREVRVIITDLGRPGAASQLIDLNRPAIVFNLAGYGVDRSERNPDLMASLNTHLVAELCERLAAEPVDGWTGLRLVHVGSAAEYGRHNGPLRETTEVHPTTDYGRTKLQGTRFVEDGCATSGLPALVARLFSVYGPGEHSGRLLPALMRTAQTGVRLGLTSGRQRRNFTYVEDVAEGLLKLGRCTPGAGRVVNLATDRSSSVREFAETAAAVLGFDAARLDFGALLDRDDEMWHGDVDVTRLRNLTAWLPSTTIADGIRRSWEFRDVQ